MSATIFFIGLAFGLTQPEKGVTEAEKAAFLKELAKLPTRGEFFTEEAVKKSIPNTRILLALTKKDLEKYDIYPFLALSRGLIDHKEPREYGIANFDKIAHPTMKLFWASVLFNDGPPSAEITAFLHRAWSPTRKRKFSRR